MRTISLHIEKILYPCFNRLYSRGVGFSITTEQNLHDFLCKDLGLTQQYVDERIQTVFLNGKAVDDVRKALIHDGAVLALSAAMPGLVGSTFRKGGHLAAMRQEITHSDSAFGSEKDSAARLTIKLFNLIANELGPALLCLGVLVTHKDLLAVLKLFKSSFEKSGTRIHDGAGTINLGELLSEPTSNDPVFLQVKSKE